MVLERSWREGEREWERKGVSEERGRERGNRSKDVKIKRRERRPTRSKHTPFLRGTEAARR